MSILELMHGSMHSTHVCDMSMWKFRQYTLLRNTVTNMSVKAIKCITDYVHVQLISV